MSGKAKFAYWDDFMGQSDPQPCFEVIENEKGFLNGSTVCGETLLQTYGIPLPLFPAYDTWVREKRDSFLKARAEFTKAMEQAKKDADYAKKVLDELRQEIREERLVAHFSRGMKP